jgi:NADP-dependent 3-hydroxy acid dehydrogenase YdfG
VCSYDTLTFKYIFDNKKNNHFNNIYEQKSNSYLDSSDVADCVAFAILPDKRNEINTILKLHTNIRQG